MITLENYSPKAFEVVERKGVGHPDTLADGISEEISRRLSRFYLDEYGEILHHNVDKVLIIAGRSIPEFGGGSVIRPPSVVVGGRATRPIDRPLDMIIGEAVAAHMKRTLKSLQDFDVEPRVDEGAPELQSLIGRGANDTSIGVGFAPLDDVEALVLRIEEGVRGIRGAGEDVKVMAIRSGDDMELIVATAMVSKYIGSRDEYEEAKARVRDFVLSKVDADVAVNAADRGDNIYLTVTGTSIEMGDDGATGRGNRGSGLITPMRPMTMEAIAGKNPVSHVGKIYNVLADRIAGEVAELDGVKETYVTLVSRIGAPLDQPMLKAARVFGSTIEMKGIEPQVEGIMGYWLSRTDDLVEEFVKGSLRIY